MSLEQTNQPYAHISFRGYEYDMIKDNIIIGRNSAAGLVDIDVGESSFVSRRHLEIFFSHHKLKLKCLGKNGIFLNDNFKAHCQMPYDLPAKCVMRFPSTTIRLTVEQTTLGRRGSPHNGHRSSSSDAGLISSGTRSTSPRGSDHIKGTGLRGKRHRDGERDLLGDGEGKTLRLPRAEQDLEHGEDPLSLSLVLRGAGSTRSSSIGEGEGREHTLADHGLAHPETSASAISSTPTSTTVTQRVGQGQPVASSGVRFGFDFPSSLTNGQPTKASSSWVGNGGDFDDFVIERGTETRKPPYSYAQLIVQAVSSTQDRQLTLSGIYAYISKNYPYYKPSDKGWQNSIRHNLSLNRYFIKVPRSQEEPGKGSFWKIDTYYEDKLITQAFRKRRLRSGFGCGDVISSSEMGSTGSGEGGRGTSSGGFIIQTSVAGGGAGTQRNLQGTSSGAGAGSILISNLPRLLSVSGGMTNGGGSAVSSAPLTIVTKQQQQHSQTMNTSPPSPPPVLDATAFQQQFEAATTTTSSSASETNRTSYHPGRLIRALNGGGGAVTLATVRSGGGQQQNGSAISVAGRLITSACLQDNQQQAVSVRAGATTSMPLLLSSSDGTRCFLIQSPHSQQQGGGTARLTPIRLQSPTSGATSPARPQFLLHQPAPTTIHLQLAQAVQQVGKEIPPSPGQELGVTLPVLSPTEEERCPPGSELQHHQVFDTPATDLKMEVDEVG